MAQGMTQVVDRLAELTANRDRDRLDVSLAGVLRELLRPESVAIHRGVGEDADRRWITSARLGLREQAASSDPAWSSLASLPPLVQFPARLQALRLQEVVVTPAEGHSLAVFPLSSDSAGLGVLEVLSRQALDTDELRQVGSILRVFRNFQSLLDYSERDTLTGLLNRTTFDSAFNRLAGAVAGAAPVDGSDTGSAGAGRRSPTTAQQPHVIGVIDIDHFKRVNDGFGHLIGDEVLLLLSRLMRSVFRYHDRLYRFGGEEFVVLMRCRNDAEAGAALQRLRGAVKAYAFPQVGSLTVSVGYAKVLPDDTPSRAFDRADRAVYWAKHHGRDQVCGFADLSARGELIDDAKTGDVELF